MRSLRVLTPYRKSGHPLWISRVELIEGNFRPSNARGWWLWGKCAELRDRLQRSWRLFRQSQDYDAVFTGSGWDGLSFCILQRVFRKKRVPHIFLDFLPELPQSLLGRAIRVFLYRLAVQGSSRALVQRRCEVPRYAAALKLPEPYFTFVPYHSTIFDTPYVPGNQGFIFAGGDGHRDYPLLIRAIRGLPYRTVIAALHRNHFRGLEIPPNVEIRTTSQEGFLQLMASSSLVVVPLKSMPEHVGGEQTYINAMTMGKPTIVTDLDADDYITNNVNGILTPPNDTNSLRAAIVNVMEDRCLAQRLGDAAKAASARFSPENFFECVFSIAEESVRRTEAEGLKNVMKRRGREDVPAGRTGSA